MNLIGRDNQRQLLTDCLQSDRAELVCVLGRRRIGKTYLIKTFLKEQIVFEISGVHYSTVQDQLENFAITLRRTTGKVQSQPASWLAAFEQLRLYIDKQQAKTKKVIFFDEFPWLAGPKSKFLAAFENFWNSYAAFKKDIVIVICGSAASWMIHHVIHNKGGLHNRITAKIKLEAFNLKETEAFIRSKNMKWSRYDILQCYMALGGVPHYLQLLKKGESVAQAIDRLLFSKNALLKDELKELFTSLFDDGKYHEAIVAVLASKRQGLSRNEIIKQSKSPSGGSFTRLINELSASGFVEKTAPLMNARKDTLYRLTDEFCFFHYKFMRKSKTQQQGTWLVSHQTATWFAWSGYAFESICMKHLQQIEHALGIAAIHTSTASWTGAYAKEMAQIDLLIDRADRIINVCEMKFSTTVFTIDKKYAQELRKKLDIFRNASATKKTILLAMITTYGVTENEYANELVQSSVTMDALFQ
jgi:uncharacterized protein